MLGTDKGDAQGTKCTQPDTIVLYIENSAVGALPFAGQKIDIDFRDVGCSELTMSNVRLAGELSVSARVISGLTLDNVQREIGRGLSVELYARGIRNLRAVDAEFENLEIASAQAGNFSFPPRIVSFERVKADGTVVAPRLLVRALTERLLWDDREDQKQVHYARKFLSEVRRSGIYSDDLRPMSRDVLYGLLRLETRKQYNLFMEYVIRFFTGYGIYIFYPLVTFLAYSIIFLVAIGLFVLKINGNSELNGTWRKVCGTSLKSMVSWDPQDLASGSGAVHGLGMAYRAILFLQITLVGLFIQNSLLVGI